MSCADLGQLRYEIQFVCVFGSALLRNRIPMQGSDETVSEDFQWYHPATVLTLSSVFVLLVTVCRILLHLVMNTVTY